VNNFAFQNPVKILFGKGQIANIANEIPLDAKILITYGGGSIKRNGVYEQVMAALEGRTVLEFGGIEPNPHFETLMQAVDLARTEKVDFLLAVGGGSVLDGTKFVAAAIPFVGDPWEIVANNAPVNAAIPLGAVLTLPATGSEMNAFFVITKDATQEKLGAMSRLVYPQFSVLDPETTFSLPLKQVSNGIVDAFTHTVEQYLTYPVNAPLQDRMAEAILKTLTEEGPKTIANPKDYDARANVMWCATMALNGLIGAGVPQDWATHNIGHELTALYGIDHAQTLAIVLPSLLRIKQNTKQAKLLQYGERVWGITQGSDAEKIEAAIAKTQAFFEAVGIPTHLSNYGVNPEDVPDIVEHLGAHNSQPLGEHSDIGLETVREILLLSA
jgi:NADP-dependent alcohol dehydrogenase